MSRKTTLLIVLGLTMISQLLTAQHAPPRILFLSSYHPSFPTFFRQIEGIRGVMPESEYIIDVEYLDSKRFRGEEHLENMRRILAYKTKRLDPYDGILCADDNALRFLAEERMELFPGVPIIFIGINDRDFAAGFDEIPDISGIVENTSIGETLRAMATILPAVDTVYAVADGTTTARAELAVFKESTAAIPGLKCAVLSLEELSFTELEERLAEIGPASAVLLIGAYHDRLGNVMSFEESLALIRAAAGRPVFGLWRHTLDYGVVGGKVVDHRLHAARAAEMLVAVLSGERPIATMPVVRESPNSWVFNHEELARFRIPENLLPPESEVLNRPDAALRRSLRALIVVSGVLLLQSSVIAALFVLMRNRRRDKKTLEQTERRFRGIFEYSPISLWEEDFSAVREYLEGLQAEGVADIPGYLAAHPELGAKFAEMIYVRDANETALRMNALTDKRELLGPLSRTLNPEEYPQLLEEVAAIWSGRADERWEIHFIRPGGSEGWGEVSLAVAPGSESRWDEVYVSIQDISDRKQAEGRILEALAEKEVLLKEVHHRVKNNLAIIIAFLHLTSRRSTAEETNLLLRDCEARVHSMARVHEGLYMSRDLRYIDLPLYLRENADYLMEMYGESARGASLTVEAEDLHFSIDTLIPLGLIVTEAVTNAIKHGVAGAANPAIGISLVAQGSNCVLTVSDTGPGFDPETLPEDADSLGLTLMHSLTGQIGGEMGIVSDENGTVIRIIFPRDGA